MARRVKRSKVFDSCFKEASKHAKKGHAAFDRALHTCIVRKAGGKAYGETLTERDYQADAKWQSRKYGLPTNAALKLAKSKNRKKILDTVNEWQRRNGYPDDSSPLTRGYLLDTLYRFGGVKRGKGRSSTDIDPGKCQAYRRYLIQYNSIHDRFYISRDGHHIGSAKTMAEAKATVDLVAGD